MSKQKIDDSQIDLSDLIDGDLTNTGGNVSVLKHNRSAIAAPTGGNDNTQGYSVGSTWIYGNTIYLASSVGTGTATWQQIYPGITVSHTHDIANITGLQTALDTKAPFSGARTANVLPRWDMSGNLVDSGLSDSGTALLASRPIQWTGVASPANNTYGIGLTSTFLVSNVPTDGAWLGRINGVNSWNINSSGRLALGKGSTSASRMVESRDAVNLQYRASYSDTVYADFGTDVNGHLNITHTGSIVRIGRDTASNTTTGANSVAIGIGAYGGANINVVAIGNTAAATGAGAVAIGSSSISLAGVAVGPSAVAGAASSVALGPSASANVSHGTAVGYFSSVAQEGTAVGRSAVVSANYGVAMGYASTASASGAVAVGRQAAASGIGSVALGYNVGVSGTGAVGIGTGFAFSGAYTVALGQAPIPNDASDGIAIGRSASLATGVIGGVALSRLSSVTGSYGVAIGQQSLSAGNGVAIGFTASVAAASGISLGNNARVQTDVTNGISLGTNALCSTGVGNLALGCNSVSSGSSSLALGYSAQATAYRNIAIGYGTISAGDRGICAGYFCSTTVDGDNSTVLGDTASSSALSGVAIGHSVSVGGEGSIAIGRSANTSTAFRSISIGWSATQNAEGTNSVSIGSSAISGSNGVALGYLAAATGARAIAIGRSATGHTGSDAIALGYLANASGNSSLALGGGSVSSALGSVALGANTDATADSTVAIGNGAQATGARSIALSSATASGNDSIAFGSSAEASGVAAMAFGRSAVCSANYAVVFGSGAYPATTIYGGRGQSSTAPNGWGIRGTGGSGTDIVGGDLYLDAGPGTGNAAAGTGRLRSWTALASGSTLQGTAVDVLTWERAKLTASVPLVFGASLAGAATDYWRGRVGTTLYNNVPTGSNFAWGINTIVVARLEASGFGIGTAAASARPLEVRSTTQAQQRWSYSDTVYGERQARSDGSVREFATGNKWEFTAESARLSLTYLSPDGFEIFGGRDLFVKSGSAYNLHLQVGSSTLFRANSTGVAFNGLSPIARPSYEVSGSSPAATNSIPVALTDSTGGTASDTLAAISDPATADAIASLNAKLNAALGLIRQMIQDQSSYGLAFLNASL